jgi:hypothetical protein
VGPDPLITRSLHNEKRVVDFFTTKEGLQIDQHNEKEVRRRVGSFSLVVDDQMADAYEFREGLLLVPLHI